MPPEIIFGNTGAEENRELIELDYLGEKVIVTPLADNQYEIRRIISSSPQAFLNPRLQPGAVIKATLAGS